METEQRVLERLVEIERAISSLTSQVDILQEEFDRQARGVKEWLERTDGHLAGMADQQQHVKLALGLVQWRPDEQSVTVPQQFEAVQQQVQGLQAMIGRSLNVDVQDRAIGAEVAEQVQRLERQMREVMEVYRRNEAVLAEIFHWVLKIQDQSHKPRAGNRLPLPQTELETLKRQSEQQLEQLEQQRTLMNQWRKESWQMYRVLKLPTWEWHRFWDWITEPVPLVSLTLAWIILIVQLALPGLIRTRVAVAEREISSELVQVNDNVNTALLRLARVEEVIGSNPEDE